MDNLLKGDDIVKAIDKVANEIAESIVDGKKNMDKAIASCAKDISEVIKRLTTNQ